MRASPRSSREETFELLKSNVLRNRLAGVELHNVALSDRDRTAVFHSAADGLVAGSLLSTRMIRKPVRDGAMSTIVALY